MSGSSAATAHRLRLNDPGSNLIELAGGRWSNGHLRFDPVPNAAPPRWDVRLASSTDAAEPIASIRRSGLWQEYVFVPIQFIMLAEACLADLAEFCRMANADHQFPQFPSK